ncbi:hypothetical protein BC829DRAFT_453684 [Chytridium lagenaria]|nr:hypothetical protein BC829DRAFT_453684 [Chytridium lagenaria]
MNTFTPDDLQAIQAQLEDREQLLQEVVNLRQQILERDQQANNFAAAQAAGTHNASTQQAQAMTQLAQVIQALQQQLLHQNASSQDSIHEAPNVQGNTKDLPTVKAQAIITNYLKDCETQCSTHDFLGDGETPRYTNHRTYVQWLQSGLQDHALTAWHAESKTERENWTFAQFSTWIQTKFSSPLSLQEAIHALEDLKQSGSAVDYTQKFEDLLQAIRAENVPTGSVKRTCMEKELFDIKDNLKALQTETERLDKYHKGKKKRKERNLTTIIRKTPTIPFGPFGSIRTTTLSREGQERHLLDQDQDQGPTPMEIGTKKLEKLTKDQRAEYWKKDGAFIVEPKIMSLTTATHLENARINHLENSTTSKRMGSSKSSGSQTA